MSALAISPFIPTRLITLSGALRDVNFSGPSVILSPSMLALIVSSGMSTRIPLPTISPFRDDEEKLYIESWESLALPFMVPCRLPSAWMPYSAGIRSFRRESSASSSASILRAGSSAIRSLAWQVALIQLPGIPIPSLLISRFALPSASISAPMFISMVSGVSGNELYVVVEDGIDRLAFICGNLPVAKSYSPSMLTETFRSASVLISLASVII